MATPKNTAAIVLPPADARAAGKSEAPRTSPRSRARTPLDGARRPTMADVARHAGVSSTTVSFVINDRPGSGISTETRDRVLAAVKEIGFRPNQQARSLVLRRTQTVGFVGDGVAGTPFAGRAISGAHDAARHHGSLLLIASSAKDPKQVRHAIDELLERQVDSLVFAAVGTRRVHLPVEIGRVPTVLINCYSEGDALPSVLPDEEAGGRAAARMMLNAGHRNVAYLAGLPGSWATRRRLKGFRAELRQAGMPAEDVSVLFGDFHSESGYELARKVLQARTVPTALFCGNDRMALGVYFALLEQGLSIPGDISVIGYDDQEELASGMHPGLTTIGSPDYEMGRLAVEHIFTGGVANLPARTYVACAPILRDSLGAPRKTL
ncbi:MAG TPA: LacI family DNA-binding transcriptional regulator [Dermatophilaceae bacterium]